MPDYEIHQLTCPDRDCRAVFNVPALKTEIQQTNFTQCPDCYEEFNFPKHGYWSIRNDQSVIVKPGKGL
jgi:hypothetical protein